MAQLAEHYVSTQKDRQYYFTSRPSIQPYVCSTLKDFIEERNYLAETIFPQLDHLCFMRGTSFKAIDLKCPIEKRPHISSMSHVHQNYIAHERLKLSLDYINSSFPYFICILGHTYGECLPQSQILSDTPGLLEIEQNLLVAANGGYPWVLEGSNKKRSFTELEVMLATSFKYSPFMYYYFRDYVFIEEKLTQSDEQEKQRILSTFASESEEEEFRIWELKTSIVDQGLPVRFFKTKEELGSLILKDWCAVIDKLYPLNSTPVHIGHEHNLAQSYHQAYAHRLCKDFVDTQSSNKLFLVLDTFACGSLRNKQSRNTSERSKTDLKSILLLHGERGCGKSTAVAKWMSSFRRCHPDATVISYFVGSSGRRDDITCFMRHCIILLQSDCFGMEMDAAYFNETFSDMWQFSLLVEGFLAAVALKPCVLVLDGVDELCGIHGLPAQQAKGFTWLPDKWPHQCKMIMTTRTSHLSHKSLLVRSDVQVEEFEITSDVDERLSIFYKHLAMSSRDIAPDLLDSITNKKRKITALQLAVLAGELRMCPDLSSCTDGHLEAMSTEQLWTLLIHHWVKHYSWSCEWKKKSKKPKSDILKTGWVVDVLCLLTTSRCGLSDDDILELLKRIGYQHEYDVSPLHWAAFRSATSKWICEKPDGLLQICHQSFRDTVGHLLLGVAMPISECVDYSLWTTMNHKRKYFHQLLLKYFQQMNLSQRVYEEVPWHLKMTGKLNELYRFLINPKTLDLVCKKTKYGWQMKINLVHDWQMLLHSGRNPAEECQIISDKITEQTKDMADQCRVMSFAAQCLKDIGVTNDALTLLLSVESLLNASENTNIKVLLWTQKIAGDLYGDIGFWQEAIIYYKKAMDNLMHLTTEDLGNQRKFLKLRGRLSCLISILNAKICFKEHSLMFENTIQGIQYTPDLYEQAAVKLCEGLYRFSLGDSYEAEKYLEECLEIRRKQYGKNHILCGEIEEYLADVLSQPQNSNYSQRLQALKYYKHVITIQQDKEKCSLSLETRRHLRLSLSSTLLKTAKLLCHDDMGNSKEAFEFLQRSLDIRISMFGLNHPLSCEVLSLLKDFKKNRSKVPLLFRIHNPTTDQKQPRSASAVTTRSLLHAHPTVCHSDSESLRFLPGPLDSCIQSGSDDLLLRCSNTILPKSNKLKYNQTEDSLWPVSKSIGKRPASVPSYLSSTISHPFSRSQTSMSGPMSDIQSLVPISRLVSKFEYCRLVHKSAWYHVPGRYPTSQTPFPPKRHQVRKEI